MRHIAIAAFAAALLLPATPAAAASMRCDGNLINKVDSLDEVTSSCGQPERFRMLRSDGRVVGAEAIFQPGRGKAKRRVEFDAERRVRDIERLD